MEQCPAKLGRTSGVEVRGALRARLAPIAAVVVLAATLGVLALPGVASAGTANCPRGYFCAWLHAGYEGERFAWYGYDGYWANNVQNGVNINNQSSSWHNNGISGPGIPSYVRVFDGFYGTGRYLICLRPGASSSYISPEVNDKPSSHYWRYGC